MTNSLLSMVGIGNSLRHKHNDNRRTIFDGGLTRWKRLRDPPITQRRRIFLAIRLKSTSPPAAIA